MEKSDSIVNLTGALIKAHKEVNIIKKVAENSYFHSKYADLPAVVEEYKKVFPKNGLIVLQSVENNGLRTTLIHESGEFLSSWAEMMPIKNDPQAQGSAITYMRRYALAAICNIASEEDDDDGVATQHKPEQKQERKTNEPCQAIGIITAKGEPNKGHFVPYTLKYKDGGTRRLSTKDPLIIETLDKRMQDKVTVCIEYNPAENPKWPDTIVGLVVIEEPVPF